MNPYVVAAVVIGIVLLLRRREVVPPPLLPANGGAKPGDSATTPQINLAPLVRLKSADADTSQPTVYEICGDISDDEPDYWDGEYSPISRTWTGRGDWHRLVHEPAQRFPIAALTDEDYVRALKLAFGLGDRVCAHKTAAQIWAINDTEQIKRTITAMEVITAIGKAVMDATVPGLYNVIDQLGKSISGLSTAEAIKLGNQGIERWQSKINEALTSEPTGMLAEVSLRPVMVAGGLAINEWFKLRNSDKKLVFFDSLEGVRDGRAEFTAKIRIGQRPHPRVSPKGTVYYNRPIAEHLPWWSKELGCDLTLRDRVYLRARTYRALDVISCVLFPYVERGAPGKESTGEDVSALEFAQEQIIKEPDYLYAVGHNHTGPLWGSIFFPFGPGEIDMIAEAKKRYLDSLKNVAMTPLATVSSAFVSFNVGGYVPPSEPEPEPEPLPSGHTTESPMNQITTVVQPSATEPVTPAYTWRVI
jgi:hypothetical protein